jgi:anti-anti-sigma regulatory factor
MAEMILRIVEEADDGKLMLRLIGRIESEHVRDLKDQLEDKTRRIVLDLSEIKLVNQAAVRFLRLSEDKGIELRNCPAYIREWIRCDRQSGDETE